MDLARLSLRHARLGRPRRPLLAACAIACAAVRGVPAAVFAGTFPARHGGLGTSTSQGPLSLPIGAPQTWPQTNTKAAPLAASATASADVQAGDLGLLSGKKGRAGGDGPGGPTPLERLQVLIYRLALIIAGLAWWAAYALDFFMTSGISVIDGSLQMQALGVADACAGLAALVAPTGSAIAAGILLRLMGALALGSGLAGAGALGSLAGPACVVLVCAREVWWFGLAYRAGAASAVLVFAVVAALRASTMLDIGAGYGTGPLWSSSSENLPPEDSQSNYLGGSIPTIPTEVQPVGPPVPLSFVASVNLTVLAFSKIFEPIGEDLDEDGEKWAKRSSWSLDESDAEPVELKDDGTPRG